MEVRHLKDDSETSTLAGRQNASVVRTLFDLFFYKQRVYKHTQPQIREILSTLLSTPPASDFEIDNKISKNNTIFSKILAKNGIFSKILLSISKSEAGGVLSNVLKISQI